METLDNINNWQSILSNLRLKNSRLKELLSEAVRNDVHPDFLEQAERYQQNFVDKDQIMELLRYDIITLLKAGTPDTPNNAYKIQYELLKKDIGRFITEFEQMVRSFSNFLLFE